MVDDRYVREELDKARDALTDAEALLAADGSTEGVVNRLYYAAFHAAQAVLYDRDVEPGSHGGVRNRFGEELVLEGPATREQGRLLTTLADLRQQADYGYEPISADPGELHDRTRAFVEAMTDLVDAGTD
ncbi:HEPN domain-containing protein [Haloglomus litoreum]|uniref:HEPN domain-containing protein n=1 Tax=Haloglomus litoreum TaxID=3034026 RepID=UPI0023E80D8C|nr:HEPN domain-containing protein [Haloglomus sp. DT116]